jgi:two-component system, OmpR family, response regulator
MKTIMVVEDDRRLARLVQLNLTAEGYNVVVYHEATEALTYLQDNSADLLLLDLMLSTVSGWEILDHLQKVERLARIPAVAITALARPEEQQRTLASGARAYLVKPFGIRQLSDMVSKLLVSDDET